MCRQWAERTPAGFDFSVKLFQKFTHPKMYSDRVEKALPFAAADAVQALVEVSAADLDEFRRGIDPLAAAGKLGALLAQFPASFKAAPESRGYVERLLRVFNDYAVAVELRHKSWSDQIAETLSLLNASRAAWVQIDEPKFRFSIRQNYLPNVAGFYYMRLHGRNAAAWWRHATSDDRYDYLYSPDELREFSETADAARRLVKKLYLYTNNHFSAKSVANAVMIKEQLDEPIEGEYPPAFVEAFSQLRSALGSHIRRSVGAPAGRRSGPRLPGTD